MDTPAPQQLSQHPTNSFQEPIKKRSNIFSTVGKILLILLFAIVILLGGYYMGARHMLAIEQTPTPTPTQTVTASASPTEMLPTPTPASLTTKAVKAGLSGATAFVAYSIDVPPGWTDARETTITVGIDKLTLTKNGYSVTIYQAPMGGGGCIYMPEPPMEMAQEFTDFVDINGKSAHYRRSWTQKAGQSITYTICQKADDDSYSVMTQFGGINVVSPNPANSAMLTEIDGMIASLVNQ